MHRLAGGGAFRFRTVLIEAGTRAATMGAKWESGKNGRRWKEGSRRNTIYRRESGADGLRRHAYPNLATKL